MIRRFGEMIMIKIKPEGLEQYKAYHANPLPGVNEMIKECHLKNYSIYQRGDYMFAYYEYDKEDFEADMAKMAAPLFGLNTCQHRIYGVICLLKCRGV